MRDQRGFSLIEMVVVAGIVGVLAAVGIGISTTAVRMSRGEAAAAQVEAFLARHRGMAIARRRDIEIEFIAPNQLRSRIRPGVGDTFAAAQQLEVLTIEGGITYRLFPGVPDTPNGFGNALPVTLGGLTPVMFASEGMFMDVANNPINATILLGMADDPLTAAAVTVLGTTSTIERWRWNGAAWTR